MPNVLIFGTGGVGSIYAYILERAGCSVTAVCRSNYTAVSTSGITLKSAKWGTVHAKPNVVASIAEATKHGPFDYILVCSKSLPGNAILIEPVVSQSTSTAIVLAQNGIGIEAEYGELYPRNPLISGVVWLPTTQFTPGVVVHPYSLERLEMGTFPADAGAEAKAKVDELCGLWARGGATASSHEDIQRERWAKIAVNASMNPVCALALCDDANFFRSSAEALGLIRDLQLEVGTVADAAGYKGVITEESLDEGMKRYEQRMHEGGKHPSMAVDVQLGRPMEVEAILGNLVRIADGVKVRTPMLRMLYVMATARNSELLRDERWKPVNQMD